LLLHVVVSDTGIGIPQDKQSRLFQTFEQLDSSMARRFGGTGLGLAISSRLVELMGGEIRLESHPGQGSTFHFTTRLRAVDSTALPFPTGESSLVGAHILVVDDNATNRATLVEMLRSWEVQVAAVEGAEAALALLDERGAKSEPFAAALIDAGLPGVDGFALAEAIQTRHPSQVRHLLMLLTSGDRSVDVSRCEALAIDGYLMKPVDPSELFEALTRVLDAGGIEPGASAAAPAGPEAVTGLRVLLAEDSLYNQTLAIGLLQRRGHSVTVANNGAEAVALSGAQPFDLVLMDVQMPEVDGLEATRRIRERERATGGHVPIMAMTAQAIKGDRERCLEAGMDEYLSKPVRSAQLYAAIDELMARARPSRSGEAVRTDVNGEPSANGTAGEGTGGVITWPRALSAVDGDPGLLADLAQAFLEESRRLVGDLDDALARSDAALLRRAAHTIKGGLRTFGADAAYDLACRLEQLGAAGETQAAAAPLSEFRGALREIHRELARFVGTRVRTGS
jgi:CheY-like chemotaxis protein/HPt (histidine-containing phosphotransfer) domain-containing protein